ncbi:hypothetical protein OF829_19165 [Sphingomonas sp. LB-2]|uniref:hypothetical protein n=1 Tax=Sphingomonas caeni TaxID=2984949 RepID=UPI0022318B40|nr:hypothetical protein [Sphingomonas caeni]MCW3849365.1 hypothetical protein [Sphingomonas caeni]
MIAIALLLATAPPLTLQVGSIDWAALPALPYRAQPAVTTSMSQFAAREARARRCPLPIARGPTQRLTVELAVLVTGEGDVRTVIPRAIQCATVEQYAAGLAAGFARNNLLPRSAAADQWYKTSLTFSWRK